MTKIATCGIIAIMTVSVVGCTKKNDSSAKQHILSSRDNVTLANMPTSETGRPVSYGNYDFFANPFVKLDAKTDNPVIRVYIKTDNDEPWMLVNEGHIDAIGYVYHVETKQVVFQGLHEGDAFCIYIQ